MRSWDGSSLKCDAYSGICVVRIVLTSEKHRVAHFLACNLMRSSCLVICVCWMQILNGGGGVRGACVLLWRRVWAWVPQGIPFSGFPPGWGQMRTRRRPGLFFASVTTGYGRTFRKFPRASRESSGPGSRAVWCVTPDGNHSTALDSPVNKQRHKSGDLKTVALPIFWIFPSLLDTEGVVLANKRWVMFLCSCCTADL